MTSLETARSLTNGPSWEGGGGAEGEVCFLRMFCFFVYVMFSENCSVSYLFFVYGRSLWAELNGGEKSLHWKANMLPLFSIMTLWNKHIRRRYLSIVDTGRCEATSEGGCWPFFVPTGWLHFFPGYRLYICFLHGLYHP